MLMNASEAIHAAPTPTVKTTKEVMNVHVIQTLRDRVLAWGLTATTSTNVHRQRHRQRRMRHRQLPVHVTKEPNAPTYPAVFNAPVKTDTAELASASADATTSTNAKQTTTNVTTTPPVATAMALTPAHAQTDTRATGDTTALAASQTSPEDPSSVNVEKVNIIVIRFHWPTALNTTTDHLRIPVGDAFVDSDIQHGTVGMNQSNA